MVATRFWLFVVACCLLHAGQAQQPLSQSSSFRIDSLPANGVLLERGWKWHAGDNVNWARPEFDDSQWADIDPTKDVMDLPKIQDGKVGWMRLKITIDSSLMPLPFALQIFQVIASEIYVDGHLIERFGELNPRKVRASFVAKTVSLHKRNNNVVIAIRFAFQKNLRYNRYAGLTNNCFRASILPIEGLEFWNKFIESEIMFAFSKTGAFFILFILHFAFFIFYPTQKTNFYFSGMALCYALHPFMYGLFIFFAQVQNLNLLMYSGIFRVTIYSSAYILLLTALYSVFNFKKDLVFWMICAGDVILLIVYFLDYKLGVSISEFGTTILNTLASLYIISKAVLAKKKNSKLILFGLICSIIGLGVRYSAFVLGFHLIGNVWIVIFDFVGVISIPICISWYLGGEFALINRNLVARLKEVHLLATEKQQILAQQNDALEKQVNERTTELQHSFEALKATQTQLIQKEKLASLGELTAGIAHEIQNPLNFVNNFSEASVELVSELEDEQQKPDRDTGLEAELLGDLKQNLQKITHHGGRASAIVKGMLEHSRTSTGQREPTDLNALANEYLRLAYQGLRVKDKSFTCELVTDFDPDLGLVEVVAQDIGRVLLNLFNNAFYAISQRAMAPEAAGYVSTVWVRTRRLAQTVEITVHDNGTGIPEAVKAKIFQPFFTTKPTGEGTGLGLSLSYDIVTKGHMGTLDVESSQDEGTTFVVKIPNQRPDEAARD